MYCYLDKDFFNLMKKFEKQSVYEIYVNIVNKFKSIPYSTQNSLQSFFYKFNFWGELNISTNNFDVFYQKAITLKKHYKDYIWLYKKLNDYKSKFVLYAVLNNFYNFNFNDLQNSIEHIFKHYFDLDLIKSCRNEVFVDVGAYVGDTVLDFINSYGENSYKKIYCYEMTTSVCEILHNNLKNFNNIIFKNNAVYSCNDKLYVDENKFSLSANKTSKKGSVIIDAVSLDNDIKEKISMIKMDIEGGEKDALIGAKNHIIKDLPILFISVYHNNTDLFKIPKLINSYSKNYNFYLRYYGGCVYPTEIVLICKPKY